MIAMQERPPATPPAPPLYVWRCAGCGRILMKLRLVAGLHAECKCKCNTLNVLALDVTPPNH